MRFADVDRYEREICLMETAMRIMEVFNDMMVAHTLNPNKVDKLDSIERLRLFSDWALEFENKYYTDDEDSSYYIDYFELTDKFATEKLEEQFGIDKEFTFDVTCSVTIEGSSMEECRKFVIDRIKEIGGQDIETYCIDEFGNR